MSAPRTLDAVGLAVVTRAKCSLWDEVETREVALAIRAACTEHAANECAKLRAAGEALEKASGVVIEALEAHESAWLSFPQHREWSPCRFCDALDALRAPRAAWREASK